MSNPFLDNLNADNISMNNAKLSANGEDLGYLQGNVTINENVTKYNLVLGMPQASVKKFIQEMAANISAQLLEFTSRTVCFGLGINRSLIESWDGSTEDTYYWETAAEDQMLREFKSGRNSSWARIKLQNRGIKTSGGEAPVLHVHPGEDVHPWEASKNYYLGDIVEAGTPDAYYHVCTTAGISGTVEPTFGATTTDGTVGWTRHSWVTPVLNTDYVISASTGEIFALPSSVILSAGVKVYSKHKCIPPECDIVPLKQTGFISSEESVLITGTDTDTGKDKTFLVPKADVSSTGLKTNATAAWVIGVNIQALHNTATPTYPLGRWVNEV